jgi:hypothetical protein
MTQLRFVKTPEQLIEAAENNLEFFDANMHAIKAWYKTEPGLIEQLIPAPLEPHADPMVRIVISRVFRRFKWRHGFWRCYLWSKLYVQRQRGYL